jgi:hypothetical protein
MQIKPSIAEIDMAPGDRLTMRVGMLRKCDIEVLSNGALRIYYDGGWVLEVK